MARWTASAKWGEAPALDGQCATLLGLALSEVLGSTRSVLTAAVAADAELQWSFVCGHGKSHRSETDQAGLPPTATALGLTPADDRSARL